jgi:hypothetical protein
MLHFYLITSRIQNQFIDQKKILFNAYFMQPLTIEPNWNKNNSSSGNKGLEHANLIPPSISFYCFFHWSHSDSDSQNKNSCRRMFW